MVKEPKRSAGRNLGATSAAYAGVVVVMAQQHKRAVGEVVEQARRLADCLTDLRPAEFLRSIPCREDKVIDLTARVVLVGDSVLSSLDHETTQRPGALADFLGGCGFTQHRLTRVTRELARHEAGAELAAQFTESIAELGRRLADSALPAVVAYDGSAISTVDLLRLTGIDWVLHCDDLNRALPTRTPIAISRGILADSVRTLADTLRRRHPGHSIEVRVPPFAAVQCGTAGEPRHTRGTPPTVVETDPLTFVRLCRGRQTWDEAVKHNHLRASGVRSDLSEWLPLY